MTDIASDESQAHLPTPDELHALRQEGVNDAVKESVKDAYKAGSYQTAEEKGTAPAADRWPSKHEIMGWEHYLTLGADEFDDTVNGKVSPIPEDKCAGLLILERSGKNRTAYVQSLMKRLDIKSPYDVTDAGPGYTNDVTAVTKLDRP